MAQFKFDILSAQELQDIKDATFRLMEKTGIKIYNDEALAILEKAGVKSEDNLVHIPRELVEKSLNTAPAKVDIYDRNGKIAMELFNRNTYFGPGVTCPYFNDPYTYERRTATKDDVVSVAKVADALENIDFLMSLCMVSDETPSLADVHEVQAIMENSTKPFLTWAFDIDNLKDIVAMVEAVAGGEKEFQEKPFMMIYAEPTTPLVHSKEALDKLIYLAKKKIPCVYSPGMTFGGTAPVTLAGALTIGLADVFTGVVISQLINPGTPIICSSDGGVLDFTSFQSAYGSPEMSLIDAAGTQIFREVGIPSFGLAGATDSKSLDAQAAMEVTAEIIMSIGAGANLVHDFGMMDVGMTGSIHLLVFCDEVVGFARRLTQGFNVDEEGLAADAIHEVGPGGNFLAEEHTMRNFRKELYFPKLGLRKQYSVWEKDGSKTMAELTRERVIDLLENHTPEHLDDAVRAKLNAIVAKAEERLQ